MGRGPGHVPTLLSSKGTQAAALAGAAQVADGLHIGRLKASLIGGTQEAVVKQHELEGWVIPLLIGAVVRVLHQIKDHVVILGIQLLA